MIMRSSIRNLLCALAGTALLASSALADDLKGEIKVDGSSTVYLITEAMVANFSKEHPGVKISVGVSGTGGGFKKFANGETDINDASRPIKPAEIMACKDNNIRYLELQVAWDGLAVINHPENTWAKKLTVEQLRKIWHPDSAAKKWSDVDPSWPNETIKLFGPGPDSGTFDYFTEAINGKEKLTRKDYEANQNPNVLVKGIEGSKYALGYFGLAYYEENKDKLQLVAVAEKEGAPYVLPSKETVLDKSYKPLSRPLFIYVKQTALKRPEVEQFVRFYLRRGDLVTTARYVEMNTRTQRGVQDKFEKALKDVSGE
jgi:phosphate transport system substrate-binding protein